MFFFFRYSGYRPKFLSLLAVKRFFTQMSATGCKLLRFRLDFVNQVPIGLATRPSCQMALCSLKLYLDWTHSDSAFRCAWQISKRHVLPARDGPAGLSCRIFRKRFMTPQTYVESTRSNLGGFGTPRPSRASCMLWTTFRFERVRYPTSSYIRAMPNKYS